MIVNSQVKKKREIIMKGTRKLIIVIGAAIIISFHKYRPIDE
jgi:hypothetical protein